MKSAQNSLELSKDAQNFVHSDLFVQHALRRLLRQCGRDFGENPGYSPAIEILRMLNLITTIQYVQSVSEATNSYLISSQLIKI